MSTEQHIDTQSMALSKFLSKAGVCSRRQATDIVSSGSVQVNGRVAANPGVRVASNDIVAYKGRVILPESPVYLMLNKPRHVLTTMSDPNGRVTVMAFLPPNLRHRVYPVGRLDRETTGLLLFTNDGDLALRLAHPRYEIKKVYQVYLDRPFALSDVARIKRGIRLDDGLARVDAIDSSSDNDKRSVRVVLHSGKKRIVRRLLECCGYRVKKLDRPRYAGLTKKGLRQGDWRYLTAREITQLKNTTKTSTF